MTDRELMQMALDALMTCQEDWIFDWEHEWPVYTYDKKMVRAAFKALRARLAQPEQDDGYCQACEGNHCTAKNGCIALDNPRAQPEPEPVAWLYEGSDIEGRDVCLNEDIFEEQKPNCIPLYTAPPQREWKGLTDEERTQIWDGIIKYIAGEIRINDFAKAIEAKLKQKNG